MKKLLGFMTMAIASTMTLTGCFGSSSSNNNDGAGNITDGAPEIDTAPEINENENFVGEVFWAESGLTYDVTEINQTGYASELIITGNWKYIAELAPGSTFTTLNEYKGISVMGVAEDVFAENITVEVIQEDPIYQESEQDNNPNYYPSWDFGYDEEIPNNDGSFYPGLGFNPEDDIYQEDGQVNDSQYHPELGFEEPTPTVCLLESGWWVLTGLDNWDTLVNKSGVHDPGDWLHWLQIGSHSYDSLEDHCLAIKGEVQ